MKTKFLAVISAVALAAILVFAGCGGSNNTPTSGGEPISGEASAQGGDSASGEAQEVSGETYDTGSFTFTLPSGWTAFPQEDFFGEEDADGNKPIDPDMIYISKDAKNELELFTAPYVLINYYPSTTTIMSSKDFYENTKDLDVTIQGKAADEAYEGDSTIIEGWSYQIIQFSTDNAQFMITIPTQIDGSTGGYSYEDADVSAVLESLTGK